MTRDGYGQAYQQAFDQTVRFLLSRGCAPADRARDIAQSAWMKGWERLYQLRDDSRVVTWVNTIALNVHRRVIRDEVVFQALPEISSPNGIDLEGIDMARILSFSRPCDRILLQQIIWGHTTQEIARRNGVTGTAIRVRLLRARRAARSLANTKLAACSAPLNVA